MRLLIEWDGQSKILDPDNSYVLGRDDSCEIYIPDPKISRKHLRFSFKAKNWLAQDLNSANGTFLASNKVHDLEITRELELFVGGVSNCKIKISLIKGESNSELLNDQTRQVSIASSYYGNESKLVGRVKLQNRLRIGRDASNDWVISNQNVSRFHAEILQEDNVFELMDLRSTNGTFLNGFRITRAKLSPGDKITIAGNTRVFTFSGLEPEDGINGTPVSIKDLSYFVGQKKLIDKVNLNLSPSTLTAVIGPSGAGKSTLLALLAGRLKPSSGRIEIAGYDLEDNHDLLMHQIGLVPQSDILHTNLTVKEALSFGARLRLPDDTSKEEKDERVNFVMKKLELIERADLRIDKLSGGQRKRASIGLELLTSPQVLLLDEPTSGLDPGLDAHVMETLRSLADDGQTVIVVTHSVDNLDFCDNVVLMASGGKLIYSGPVSSVFKQLGKKSWAEIFRLLATSESYLLAQEKHDSPIESKNSVFTLASNKKSRTKQILTLASRYRKVIFADKFYLSLLAIIPIIVGCIAYLAGSKYGLGAGYKSEFGFQINPYAQGTILILILGSVFIGLSTSIQEIIKENAIRAREQSIGVRSSSYLISKIFVLSSIIVLQMIIFVNIVLFNRPASKNGLLFSSSKIEILIICILLGFSAMLLGLLLSAFLTSNEQAMPALVGTTMIQIVLSGVLPLSTSSILDSISKVSPSYWATNSIASSINLVQISRVLDESKQQIWAVSKSNLSNSIYLIVGMAILFYAICLMKLKRLKRN